MINKLLKTPKGRLLVHTIVLCNNVIHLRKSNIKFYLAEVQRFILNIG